MAEQKTDTKKDYVGEINKSKNPTAIILASIVIITILAIGMIGKSCSTDSNSNGKDDSTELEWKLCWTGIYKGSYREMCGTAKNLIFDKEGEVLSMTVFYPKGTRTFFSRKPNERKGFWEQASNSGGWWTLEKISPTLFEGKQQGNDRGDKIYRLVLFQPQ